MRHTTIIRTAATAATVALLTIAPATAALATDAPADEGDSTPIWELATKLPVPEDPCADYEQQLVEDDPTGSIPPELLKSYDEDCEDGSASGSGEDSPDSATDPEPEPVDETGDDAGDGTDDEDEADEDETATDDPGDTDPSPVPTSGTETPSSSSAGGEGQDGEAQDEGDSASGGLETPAAAPPDDEDTVTTATARLDTSAPEVHATPLATQTAGETRRSPLVLALALGLSGALLMGSGVAAGHAIAARRR